MKKGKLLLRYFLGMIILIVGSVFLGTFLIWASFHIPVNLQYKENAQVLLWDQWTSADYPTLSYGQQYFSSYRPGVFDGGTVTNNIMKNSYNYVRENYLYEAMIPDYARYWHGYVVFLRPVLYFIEYKDLEIINSFILILTAIWLCVEIAKKKNALYAMLFASSFILTMPMIVGVCLQYFPNAMISYLAILFMLHNRKFLEKKGNIFFLMAFVGILTTFIDVFTFSMFTWGIPIVWWILLGDEKESAKKNVFTVIQSAISWVIGFTGMWAGKWVVASVVLKENIILNAINQILKRTGESEGFTLHNRFYALYQNWRHYCFIGFVIIMAIWLAVWIYFSVKNKWVQGNKTFALALIFVSPLVWYFFCAEHTAGHHLFTYRIYNVLVSAGFALMLESRFAKERVNKNTFNEKLVMLLRIGIALVAGFGLMCFTYEEGEVSNKAIEGYEEVSVDGPIHIEMDFTPSYKNILGYCVAFLTEEENGHFDLKIMDGGNTVYEETIPTSDFTYYQYNFHKVKWKLEPGKTYRVVMDSVDINKPVTFYLNDYDDSLYSEVSTGTLNGEELNAKFCVGENYWTRPFSMPRKLYIWGTWFAVIMLGQYVFYKAKKAKK